MSHMSNSFHMLHPRNYFSGVLLTFSTGGGVICFHRQVKQFELNFFVTKIILQMAKPSGLVLNETSAFSQSTLPAHFSLQLGVV